MKATLAKVALVCGLAATPGCSDRTSKEMPVATSGTLRLVREKKVAAILGTSGSFEASGVAIKDGALHIVFDNTAAIATVGSDLSGGTLSGPATETSSQYEAITFAFLSSSPSFGHAFVSVEGSTGTIVDIDGAGVAHSMLAPGLTFANANKGVEGLAWIPLSGGDGAATSDHLLALSEGDGALSVLERAASQWNVIATLPRPAAAASFGDFSDVALRPRDAAGTVYDIAITSQRSSAVWLGTLNTAPLRLDAPGVVYGFPTNPDGTFQYCTIEGFAFLDERTFAVVSDKAGSNDGPGCKDEDQSVHVFTLP